MGRLRTKPVKKTRLTKMLATAHLDSGMSETEIGARFGFSKQAFNNWKAGVAPRVQMYKPLAQFLCISPDQMKELADEAKLSTGTTKLPDMGAPVMGRGSGSTVMLDNFASGFAKPAVAGCYAVRVDGRHLWINPRLKPVDGNTVLVRADDVGRLMTWPVDVEGEVHVVVLAEMV